MQRSSLRQSNGPSAVNGQGQVNGHNNGTGTHDTPQDLDLDAVVIGGGFSGVYLLYRLRQEGFKVKLVEAGSGLGGIWHWNNYPGARVDSQYPVYALDIPEVYNTWNWTEQYPAASELQAYFKHVDKTLNISADTLYNTRVASAHWNDGTHTWQLACDNGTAIRAKFMHCCLGFAAKRFFPSWPGIETFKGYLCHSSFWPQQGEVDVRGKKVAVIGNGATGVQLAQETAKTAEELTVFIRTPNTCIPMQQAKLGKEAAEKDRETIHDKLHAGRYANWGGFLYPEVDKGVFDDSPEEIEKALEDAWEKGGFAILYSYGDILSDEKSNRVVYDFWAKKTRKRISDSVKREILAPLEPPHPFAGKRPSLEQDYYEQMDRPHVKVVNLKEVDVSHVVPEGIVTSDGVTHQLDVIAFATGFDSMTGGFTEIDMRGIDNESLSEKWNTSQGALSYLGIAVHNFPNMFYTYGPHSPTAYGNGPSIVQPQGDWIIDMMKRMRDTGKTKINAQQQAEAEWKKEINELHSTSVRDKVDSWYTGTNIPGKPRQALNYNGGLPMYLETIREKAAKGYEGFDLS